MALSSGIKVLRYGPPAHGGFGYQVAPGEQVWRGGIVALNTRGYLQRVQTGGSVVVVGLCSQDYSNVGVGVASADYVQVERGWWALGVPGAVAADINAPVFATDDNTLSLTPAVSAVLGGADTGNGTFGGVAATAAAVLGDYQIAFTAPTTFSVTDPRGFALPAGTVGTAYSQQGVSFTITAGGTAFVAGDTANVLVGGMLAGTLSGFDKGLPVVRIQGS